MTLRAFIVAALLLSLGACATPPEVPAFRFPTLEADANLRLDELARVATLAPEQRRREVAELDAIRRPSQVQRFRLAALLEREDSVESLERSLKVLNALAESDARNQAVVEVMKRSLKARIELKQQSARNQELQGRLEQIKALEKSLQQRATPAGTP